MIRWESVLAASYVAGRNFTAHAVALQPIRAGRFSRAIGEPLCRRVARESLTGAEAATEQRCPACLTRVRKLGLGHPTDDPHVVTAARNLRHAAHIYHSSREEERSHAQQKLEEAALAYATARVREETDRAIVASRARTERDHRDLVGLKGNP